MDEQFVINIDIAGKKYSLTIERKDEELMRKAARQVNSKILQYREHFSHGEVDTRDLLAMVAFQLSMNNLQLESRNDTGPFTEKIQQLTVELEQYLK